MSKRRHKAERVRVGDQAALIDKKIVPLIKELWRAGLRTVMSCQADGYGLVWVDFDDVSNGIRFLNIVARFEPEKGSLYRRMLRHDKEDINEWWLYEVFESDLGLHDEKPGNEWHAGKPDFLFTFTVRFPPADLAEVVTRLKEHNRQKILEHPDATARLRC